MNVRVTFDFSAEERAALSEHMGHAEPLQREELHTWALRTIRATLDVIVAEHDELTRGENDR